MVIGSLWWAVALAVANPPSGALGVSWGNDGRIGAVTCGGRPLVAGGAAGSGFAIRAVGRDADWQPVSGQVVAGTHGVTLDGRTPDGRLAVAATVTAQANWLRLRGEVRNLDGGEHAVSLRFALPVACAGWRWWEQLHRATKLTADRPRRLGLASPLGTGTLAVRPVAAISDDASTLGLVVPWDQQMQTDFVADAASGQFAVLLEFAMTRHCPRFHRAAPFEFYVVGVDNNWGLRAVLERTYAARPDWVERHVPGGGGWFAWGDILRQPAPATDYGLLFHEQPESAAGWENDQALGILPYQYIEQGLYQMCLGDYHRAPTRDEVLQRVADWAKPETQGRLLSVGFETQEKVRRICQALLVSGSRDQKQQLVIGGIGQWPWIRGTHWAAQFPLNLCPTIPDGAGAMRLDEVREGLRTPQLKGIYLDSYSWHMERVNYALEQLQYLPYPPQFEAKTGQPCSLAVFAANAWVEALWQMLPPDQRNIMPNLFEARLPYPYHRFTVLGKEYWIEPTGALMQLFRAVANRKVVTQLPAYEDVDERFLRNLLLLDVFPGGYARRSADPPTNMRAAYRRVVPLLRLLDRLGWEPVTQVVPAAPGLQVERYGAAPGPVAVCVHNSQSATRARVLADTRALALPADAWPVDVLDGGPLQYERRGDQLAITVPLPGDSTTVLVLGNATAHAQWSRWLAEDRLAEASRCLAEYRLRCRRGNKPAAAVDLGGVSAATPPDQVAAQARRLGGDDPCLARVAQLLDLAAAHLRQAADPRVAPSRPVTAPPDDSGLPWTESFDQLSPDRWQLPAQRRGWALTDGRLEMELPRDRRDVAVSGKTGFPFVPVPLCLEWDFMFRHGGHDKYLMMSTEILPSLAGGDEYLRVRIDGQGGKAQIRLENHRTPPSGYTYALTKYAAFEPNRPHHLRLTLDQERFQLVLDDRILGEGPHECTFTRAYVRLSLASGHMGQGDVCWWDNLVARAVKP